MGPLTLADFIGLDTCLSILRVLQEGFGDPKSPSQTRSLVRMVDAGWLGRKTKRFSMTMPRRKHSDMFCQVCGLKNSEDGERGSAPAATPSSSCFREWASWREQGERQEGIPLDEHLSSAILASEGPCRSSARPRPWSCRSLQDPRILEKNLFQ